jgi:hypothetical protein
VIFPVKVFSLLDPFPLTFHSFLSVNSLSFFFFFCLFFYLSISSSLYLNCFIEGFKLLLFILTPISLINHHLIHFASQSCSKPISLGWLYWVTYSLFHWMHLGHDKICHQ